MSRSISAGSSVVGATEAQFGSVEREGASSAFLTGGVPPVALAAPEAENAVRFLC